MVPCSGLKMREENKFDTMGSIRREDGLEVFGNLHGL